MRRAYSITHEVFLASRELIGATFTTQELRGLCNLEWANVNQVSAALGWLAGANAGIQRVGTQEEQGAQVVLWKAEYLPPRAEPQWQVRREGCTRNRRSGLKRSSAAPV